MKFKNFKKLHSNEHTTTFHHKDGHQIRVAHNKLSEDMRKQLMDLPKFADGGEVDDKKKKTYEPKSLSTTKDWASDIVDNAKNILTPAPPQDYSGLKQKKPNRAPASFAQGGRVTDNEIKPKIDMMNMSPEQLKNISRTHKAMAGKYEEPYYDEQEEPMLRQEKELQQYYANGGSVDRMNMSPLELESQFMNPLQDALQFDPSQPIQETPQSQEAINLMDMNPEQMQGISRINKAQAGQLQEPISEQAQPQMRQGLANQPAPTMQQPQQQSPLMQPIEGATTGMNMQLEGLMGQAGAESEIAKFQQQALRQEQNQIQGLAKRFEENYSGYKQHSEDLMHDIEQGHIDPERYMNNLGTGGQIATAIGLVLGGLGMGADGKNPALEFLSKKIDNDLRAQEKDMDNKHNLLRELTQQFGNKQDAMLQLKAVYAGSLANKLQQAALAQGTPMAMARAAQAMGPIVQMRDNAERELALRNAALQGTKQGDSDSAALAIPILVPKEQQAKAFEELNDYKEIKTSAANLDRITKEIENLQSFKSRAFSPLQSASQIKSYNTQINFLAKELANKVSDTEMKILDDSHIGFTDSHETAQTKINNLKHMLNSKAHTSVLKGNRINLPPIFTPMQGVSGKKINTKK